MKTIPEIRRVNLQRLIDNEGSQIALAHKLGHVNGAFISQMLKDPLIDPGYQRTKHDRTITEKTARKIERKLYLPTGYMDTDHDNNPGLMPPVTAGALTTQGADETVMVPLSLVQSVLRLVGSVAEGEQVNLTADKLTRLAHLALDDALIHGGMAREDHIRQLLKLLKQ